MRAKKRARSAKQEPSFRKRPFLFATLAVCLATLGILIVRHRSSVRPKNVVLISIDTLHAGHLSCYGYQRNRTPNLDRLADEGTLFENVTTTVPLTLPAHASIFTGRNPVRHGVVDNFTSYLGDDEETLAEVLGRHGFATGGFVGAFVLDSSWGVAQGFDEYFDDFEVNGAGAASIDANERRGDEVLRHALEWIRRPREKPFFLFIHFYDPHAPYDPPAPFREGCDSRRPIECYDGEVAFVDSLVGQLMAELEAAGLLEQTLVVALGDHGESLGAHGESTHGFFLYDATVQVPLIMKGPGVPSSTRVGTQVRTVDVLPTILDLLGLPGSSSVDGVSLRPLLVDPQRDLELVAYVESQYPLLQFGWAPLTGIRTERYKFIDAPRRELYDLALDPGESHNLVDERPEIVGKLDAALTALREESTPSERDARLPDPEAVERLRALGYVVAPSTEPRSGSFGPKADPKDKIELFNRLSDARVSHQRGDMVTALSLLDSVIEEDPQVALAHLMMGNLLLETGNLRRAVTEFQTVLDGNDENVEAWFGLGVTHKRLKMYAPAAEELERCLALDPNYRRAVTELAEVSLGMGDAGRAERLLLDRGEVGRDRSVKLLLADALFAQGKDGEALTILDTVERSEPEDERILLSLGSLFLKGGNEERAVAAYRRAVRAPSRSRPSREEAEVWNGIGPILARHSDPAGAALAFQKAVERDPSLAPAYNNLGIIRAQAEDLDAAEAAFLQAIEKAPDFAEAYYNLGNLYLQAGDPDRALSMFRRALAIRPDYARARAKLEQARALLPKKP